MKITLIILFSIHIIGFSQCTTLYGYRPFEDSNGVKLNQVDSNGYYTGRHYYGDNELKIFNDTTAYKTGFYKEGIPVGNWIEHCDDGTFSIGPYNLGIQVSKDSTGEIVRRNQGIYKKVGTWTYYSSDSSIVKVEKYESFHNSKGWTTNTYLLVNEHMILKEYKFNSKHLMNSRLKKTIEKTFRDDGSLHVYNVESFWREISIAYDPNGNRIGFYKTKILFGKRTGKTVLKTFNEKRKITKKVVGEI